MKKLVTIVLLFASAAAFAQGQMQKEASGSLTFVSGQIMKLAEAIPADKYAWTPAPGVRRVADVLGHVISANYFFASKLGAALPAGVNMETIEKDLKTKEQYAAALKQSFETMITAVKNTKDGDLPKKVEFPFPGEYTNMSAIMISMAHANEHLGQLIAYARTNGIKPPWSE